MIKVKKENHEIYPIIVSNSSSLKSINFFLIKSNQSLTLIDAGLETSDCLDALVDTLNRNGLTIKDLTEIILTHHHIDHVGLVDQVVSLHPIPVYVHPVSIPRLKRDNDFLEMRIDFFANLYEQMGCDESGWKQINYLKQSLENNKHNFIQANLTPLKNNRINDFDIIHVPGHAPDQIALYDKTRNWLISGDLLINHISSNALVEPDHHGKRMFTLIDHMNSLKKCQSLPIETVFPGHGILIENPIEIIQKRLDSVVGKAVKLKTLIQQGHSTADDLAQAFYKKSYEKQFSLVMSEIIGHLDYLEVEGEIEKTFAGGVWQYSIS
ncbi:MBL fold metallo-hydrolase [Salipaludibacillus sp. CF4.18]|uniref:MBL fold metallo-hydrolase n=1 Tax=Salipaludibacillus sp. CF4.18 TaxID=3373081 RepID=UPI003EE4D621